MPKPSFSAIPQMFTPRKAQLALVIGFISACSHQAPTEKLSDTAPAQQKQSIDRFANEIILENLVDFDSSEQRSWLSTSGAKAHWQQNKQNHQLTIEFSKDDGISEVSITPTTPWALTHISDYNLAVDVANPGDESVHLYLSIENLQENYQSRSLALPPGFSGTLYFPITGEVAETETGLWGEAPLWPSNDQLMIWRSWRGSWGPADGISQLKFFALGVLKNHQVTIDNIRLRKNPPTPNNWMVNVIDQFGQYTKHQTPLTIQSEEQLKQLAREEMATLENSNGMPHRSRFGGYTQGPKLEATGYFRTQKVDGKWWMVDPEGYVFFSHGPANVRMANMSTITGVDFKDDSVRIRHDNEITPEDSMGIVQVSDEARRSRFITSALRHNMFEWLPDYDHPLANHYSYRRSTHRGDVKHGETFSFYRANLERRYGEESPGSFLTQWHEVTAQRMKHWGFTSFGNWVDPAFYDLEKVPYFANGWIIGNFQTLSGKVNHWGLMPDPYDPIFSERAEATIQAIAKDVKASPWCVGIFIDNEKSWGEREGTIEARYGVILDALSKNADKSPAKKAFSQIIKEKYPTLAKLNAAWQSNIASWQTFDRGVSFTTFNEQQVTDLSMLLERLGEQYFTVVHGTLDKYLPNHLYMGARMANWGMPDEVIKASVKYSDVLSFNIYEDGMQESSWKFLEGVDLPVVIGEFHIGTTTDAGMFNPGIVHATDRKDRARKYTNYMNSVLEKPYMVGAHWFQYVDEPTSGRAFDGENANIGFVTVTDTPYPELIKAVQGFTGNMYQKRLK